MAVTVITWFRVTTVELIETESSRPVGPRTSQVIANPQSFSAPGPVVLVFWFSGFPKEYPARMLMMTRRTVTKTGVSLLIERK